MKQTKTITLIVITLMIVYKCSCECQDRGVKILVRPKQPPYLLQFQCLCPFDYYGKSCENIRDINCVFSNQKVTHYAPLSSPIANLQFQLECYLVKMNGTRQSLDGQTYKLPLTPAIIQNQTKSNNYKIGPDFQIIWANDTTLFENNGQLKRNEDNINMTDEQILAQYKPYQFTYPTYFFGVPNYNSNIYHKLSTIGVKKMTKDLGQVQIQYTEIPQRKGKKIVGKFNVSINKQWQEFEVTRLELLMKHQYGQGEDKLDHLIGMNSGKWRMFNPNFKRGTPIQYNNYKIPSSFFVILAFLLLFSLISGGRLALKYWKKWKSRKQRKLAQQQLEEETKQNV